MMIRSIQILNWITGVFGAMISRVGDIGIS